MRVWLTRAAIVLGLSALGAALWFLLSPHGFGWIVWVLFGLLGLAVAIEVVVRVRRAAVDERAWSRWQRAVGEPELRGAAITEVRARIDRARRFGPRLRMEHARLATQLAELLEAQARSGEAIEALAKVPVDSLDALPAAVIRHARAQAYLHAGDAESAAQTLAHAPERTGDEILDTSLALARAAVALHADRFDEASEKAAAVRDAAEPGDELHDEALAIEAAVRSLKGDREAARALLDRIDAAGRARLALLGSARVRELLEKQ
jgi:tetratricopeptide (TPR) repeat protein